MFILGHKLKMHAFAATEFNNSGVMNPDLPLPHFESTFTQIHQDKKKIKIK